MTTALDTAIAVYTYMALLKSYCSDIRPYEQPVNENCLVIRAIFGAAFKCDSRIDPTEPDTP